MHICSGDHSHIESGDQDKSRPHLLLVTSIVSPHLPARDYFALLAYRAGHQAGAGPISSSMLWPHIVTFFFSHSRGKWICYALEVIQCTYYYRADGRSESCNEVGIICPPGWNRVEGAWQNLKGGGQIPLFSVGPLLHSFAGSAIRLLLLTGRYESLKI